MDAEDWDRRYAAAPLVWSSGPNAVVARETAQLRPGTALDLASGEGRNALWLAEHGWRVTAVDFSPVATRRATELAAERLGDEADRLTAVAADVGTWTPPASVDLTVLAYFQVPADLRRRVHRTAAEALAPGGTFLLVAHHSDNLEHGVGGPQDATVLFTENDVVADLEGTGLVVDRAERVDRPVADAGHAHGPDLDEQRPALDVLVRAHRPRGGRVSSPVPQALPITGVVFDFHHTLVHGGDAAAWLEVAWRRLARDASPSAALGPDHAGAVDFLDHIWDHARDLDPDNERDLDPRRHREVFFATVARLPVVDAALADALYATAPDVWEPYDDTLPVLNALRDNGIRVAMLSNVGYDLRPVVARTGIGPLLDGMVMSQELGVVKPDPRIFQAALDAVDRPAAEVLMVGDAWRDDGAAAALGIRTLILPRTDGAVHGLELVLRLVGVSTGRAG